MSHGAGFKAWLFHVHPSLRTSLGPCTQRTSNALLSWLLPLTPQADTSEGEALMFDDQGFVSVLVRDGVLTLYYWTASSPDPVAVINLPAAA